MAGAVPSCPVDSFHSGCARLFPRRGAIRRRGEPVIDGARIISDGVELLCVTASNQARWRPREATLKH